MNPIGSRKWPGRATKRCQLGVSLIELMISMTIGLMLIATLTLIFANTGSALSELQKSGQRIDNGRYALEVLTGAVQNAGYFAEFNPRQIALPGSMPDPCLVDAVGLGSALALHVQGYDDVTADQLSCVADVKPGTDITVVRRVNGCVSGALGCSTLTSGSFAFQASLCGSAAELGSGSASDYYVFSDDTSKFTKKRKDCATPANVRAFVISIYFVAANDRPGDGIPTLKRAELTGGLWPITSLVQGIEDMQIEYGLDTDANGSADVYTPAPAGYLGCTSSSAPTCAQHWASVVTARVIVMARNGEKSSGYADAKTYTLGRLANGPNGAIGTDKRVGPLSDGYKRTVFQQLIRFQNPGSRNSS
jgi:type IV pilus assembly protein PilW